MAIAKERLRSDRHNLTFSLIRIDLAKSQKTKRENAVDILIDILNKRLRLTDERGAFGNGSIGVLLPHTPGVGAQIVLDSLLQMASDAGIEIHATIHVYPNDKMFGQSFSDVEIKETISNQSEFVDEGMKATDFGITQKAISNVRDSATAFEKFDPSDVFAPAYPRWKRAMDIGLASAGLLASLPILVGCAIAIRLTSKGPIFFTQLRTGQFGKPFRIVKLRSMVVDAEELKSALENLNERNGPAFKMKHDPRVTTVGKFMRATGLDELPQLWNVLKGDMAIVGPRPLPCDEDAKCDQWHRRRLDTKPGITCFWQIMKQRVEDFDDWMRLDLKYLSKRSFRQDIVLMVKTVAAVVLGRVGH